MDLEAINMQRQAAACSQHVLLVDDAEMDGYITSCILRQNGYEVTLVKSGAEAVAAAAMTDFRIILMDLRMPGMNGFEATQRIRKHSPRHLPIVALSAVEFAGQRERILSAGMNDFLQKPLDLNLLFTILTREYDAEVAPTDKKSANPATLETHVRTRARMKGDLSEIPHKYVLSQPNWADFSMEGSYWNKLQLICLMRNISPQDFINDAKQHFPNLTVKSAVRTHVLESLSSKISA